MSSEDLYGTLGVGRNADQEDIKKAYRDLAKEHHPDRGGDPDRFSAVVRAYNTLSDEQARFEYDRLGYAKGDKEDNDLNVAMSLIDSLVDEVVNREIPLDVNIIEAFRETVREQIREIDRLTGEAKRKQSRCERLLSRLKGEGQIRTMFEKRRSSFVCEIRSLERKKQQTELAIEILKDWDFDPEEGFSTGLSRYMTTSSTTSPW